ncbi:MAG: response regulator [Candidatus Bathyarchaeia archaeon]
MKIRILHIEDNPDDQLILKRSLTEKMPTKFELTATDTAAKGLAKLEKENFDIIILDYRLPDMTGIEVVKQLQKKHNKTPIILVTGKGSENIAVEAMKLGIRDYMNKDEIASTRLIDSIKEILLASALPETVNIETAKAILDLFAKNPVIQIESTNILTTNPESEIPTEQLVPTLKSFAEIKILEEEHSRSVIVCPDCDVVTSTLYLECPECESSQMTKEEALEHFDCGNIDFRSKYDNGEGRLVCPKCEKKLKVIGVDYRKIENWYKCSNKHFFGQPNFKFGCSKCSGRFTLEETRIDMLHNYKLTTSGLQMLKLGVKATQLTEKSQDKKASQKT